MFVLSKKILWVSSSLIWNSEGNNASFIMGLALN